jgi:hypothetical protein
MAAVTKTCHKLPVMPMLDAIAAAVSSCTCPAPPTLATTFLYACQVRGSVEVFVRIASMSARGSRSKVRSDVRIRSSRPCQEPSAELPFGIAPWPWLALPDQSACPVVTVRGPARGGYAPFALSRNNSGLDGAFVWARTALNGPSRRFSPPPPTGSSRSGWRV